MSNAFKSGRGWIAEFRSLNHEKGKRLTQVRVPAVRFDGIADESMHKGIATAYAAACDAACRVLEGPHTAHDVKHALDHRAITEAQSIALIQGVAAPNRDVPTALTIEAAALAHPATQRMPLAERWRYLDHLAEFTEATGFMYVQQVTMKAVLDWITAQRTAGNAYHTRRHRMLFLRRATRMGAPMANIPDVLYGFKLDKDKIADRRRFKIYELDELAAVLVQLEDRLMYRELAAIGLMGGLGLRPSECRTVSLSDVREDDTIACGTKTESSQRIIPMPPCVARWVRAAIATRHTKAKGDTILITYHHGPFSTESFARFIRLTLADIGARAIMAKEFRKTFSTWTTRANINPQQVEAFMGHASALVEPVTSHHYLGEWLVHELRPAAETIDRLLVAAMARVRSQSSAKHAPPPTHPPTHKSQTLAIR